MASLTETAYYSRVGIKVMGISLVVLMVGRVIFGGLIRYWQATHPEPPPPPTVAFGVLPPLSFPKKDPANLTYTLQTPSGTLPSFGDRAEVFLMPEKRPRFLALDQATQDAQSIGFKETPTARTEIVYRFYKSSPLPAILDMNIYTGRMTMTVDWSQDPNYFVVKQLPSEDQAINDVKGYLNRAKLVPDDLKSGEAAITFLKASGNSYRQTISLSEADFIRVDLFRAAINNEFLSVTADPRQGVVRGVVSGNAELGKVVQVEYNYYPVEYETVATYPLKDVAQAWLELQQNMGYVAQVDPGVKSIVVRRVTMGYYDAFEPQEYFQPVYVFTGDDNFVGYVPALADMAPSDGVN